MHRDSVINQQQAVDCNLHFWGVQKPHNRSIDILRSHNMKKLDTVWEESETKTYFVVCYVASSQGSWGQASASLRSWSPTARRPAALGAPRACHSYAPTHARSAPLHSPPCLSPMYAVKQDGVDQRVRCPRKADLQRTRLRKHRVHRAAMGTFLTLMKLAA